MSITFDQPRIAARPLRTSVPTTRTTYVAARPAARPAAASVRLTGRGRIAVVAVALAVLTTLAIVFGSAVVASNEAPVEGTVTTVTVQPGQTLWSIAAEARPDADIRATVDQIVRLNALEDGAELPIGATLAVPVQE